MNALTVLPTLPAASTGPEGTARQAYLSVHLPVSGPRQPADMRAVLYSVNDFARLYGHDTDACSVAVVEHRASGRLAVLRSHTRSRLGEYGRYKVLREIAIHARSMGPNIATFYMAWEDGESVHVCTEYVGSKTMRDWLRERGGRAEEAVVVREVAAPLACALAVLHGAGVMHRDLRPESVCVGSDGALHIADLSKAVDCNVERADARVGVLPYLGEGRAAMGAGMHEVSHPTQPSCSHCPKGPLLHALTPAAPEIVQEGEGSRKPYGLATDVFSLGLVVFECITGIQPFARDTPELTRAAIAQGAARPAPDLALSDAARNWLHLALQSDPAARPSALDLISHPWLRPHCEDCLRLLSIQLPSGSTQASSAALAALSSKVTIGNGLKWQALGRADQLLSNLLTGARLHALPSPMRASPVSSNHNPPPLDPAPGHVPGGRPPRPELATCQPQFPGNPDLAVLTQFVRKGPIHHAASLSPRSRRISETPATPRPQGRVPVAMATATSAGNDIRSRQADFAVLHVGESESTAPIVPSLICPSHSAGSSRRLPSPMSVSGPSSHLPGTTPSHRRHRCQHRSRNWRRGWASGRVSGSPVTLPSVAGDTAMPTLEATLMVEPCPCLCPQVPANRRGRGAARPSHRAPRVEARCRHAGTRRRPPCSWPAWSGWTPTRAPGLAAPRARQAVRWRGRRRAPLSSAPLFGCQASPPWSPRSTREGLWRL